MSGKNPSAVLLLSCPDQKGLVARLSDFVFKHNGNLIHSDQHTDPENGTFFIRLEWDLTGFAIPREALRDKLAPLAFDIQADWVVRFSDAVPRTAIFVSKEEHCLYDLLLRHRAGEFIADIALVVSNHPDLENVAKQFSLPFHLFPISKDNKQEQEQKELALLQKVQVDLVVLARYMQILTKDFVAAYPNRIINIHHSFLPAFIGSDPYGQAHQRGVKIIGATAHYATEDLDQGPIIEQDVVRVSHRDDRVDLIRKGRDLEKSVLARAVRWHLENRILVYGRKTVVFD